MAFNRTMKELKYLGYLSELGKMRTFNRTMKELKYGCLSCCFKLSHTFNRTMKELKSYRRFGSTSGINLLIAP